MSAMRTREATRIALRPYELEWAYLVGVRRNSANLAKKNAAHYDPKRMENNVIASIAACVAEISVAKCLGLYWSGSVWDSSLHDLFRHEPDVGNNIEVKRIREPGNPLVVRKRESTSDKIIVSVYAIPPAFESVEILGWLSATEAWELGDPADYDPEGTRLVGQESLRDIRDLEIA